MDCLQQSQEIFLGYATLSGLEELLIISSVKQTVCTFAVHIHHILILVGADLPGAVGANAPNGKGSVGACTQRKNGCVYYISGVFFQFNVNCAVDYLSIRLYMHQIRSISAWAPLQTPLWELTALPRPYSCIYGGEEKGKGKGRAGREEKGRWGWEGKEGEEREERRMGACTHWDFRKSAPMLILS